MTSKTEITAQVWREYMEECFRGYTIPENIIIRAKEICKRFNITGLCDPVYICNCIAEDSGCGDGESHFFSDKIQNEGKTADYLMKCYGSNIEPEGKVDLLYILQNGKLEKQRMIDGLKQSKFYQEYLQKIARNRKDDFHVEYIGDCIKQIDQIIKMVEEEI